MLFHALRSQSDQFQECQQSADSTGYYASAPNDVWSLGVILVNLACGRNPWRKACLEDSTFGAFLRDRHFLRSILPLSTELDDILHSVFQCDPSKRISIDQLRDRVAACPKLTARSHVPTSPDLATPPLTGYPHSGGVNVTLPPTPPASPPPFSGHHATSPVGYLPSSTSGLISKQPSLASSISSGYKTPSEFASPISGLAPAVPLNVYGNLIAFPEYSAKVSYQQMCNPAMVAAY